MDYRSLVHHFENGVWMYKCRVLPELKADLLKTMEQSEEIRQDSLQGSFVRKVICAVVRIFAPML